MTINRILWHYTVGAHIPSIMHEGMIKLATAHVPRGERPIVWFSSNQKWEQTANKRLQECDGRIVDLNMEQTAHRCGGLWRIGVRPETAPHNFQRLVFLSKMNLKIADALIDVSRKKGANVAEWFGTFYPVERSNWMAVEGTLSGRWSEAGGSGTEPKIEQAEISQVLSAGLAAYREGHPLQVLDEQGLTLHGQEAPKSETSSVNSNLSRRGSLCARRSLLRWRLAGDAGGCAAGLFP